jgi:2-dehydro-3-deoxyphosphogluconate aldolase / (4S)-4-hydroxy-2-oxoglutarate aldolase
MTAAAELEAHRVVPVVVLDDAARADDLGAALVAGGLPVAEVTFRTPDAAAVLGRLAGRGDLLVGAGTVITPDQVDRARDAGAGFVVSPGLSADVVHRCHEVGLPVLPGVSTATEIIRALDLGVGTVKFFPAEACGGLATVKALAAAFPQVRFVPTGGITAQLAPTYLEHRAVAAVGGSWMVAPDLLAAGQWAEVTARCAATVAAVRATDTPTPVAQGASG